MILAIDTATRVISLALHGGDRLLAERTWRTENVHTVELAPQVALLLDQSHRAPADLTAVAVCIGPGSYTGMRIGLAYAKGLALALARPVIGVSTFEVSLLSAPRSAATAAVLVPAGRGRHILARFERGDGGLVWRAAGEPAVYDLTSLGNELRSAPAQAIVGEWDGLSEDLVAELATRSRIAAPHEAVRRAGALAEVAWRRQRDGAGGLTAQAPGAELRPLYVGAIAGMAS